MNSEQVVLRKAIFDVTTKIPVPELFEGEKIEFYRNESGYNVIFNCGDIPVQSDLSEFYQKLHYLESRLALHSIVYNKKYIINDYHLIIVGKYGEQPIHFVKTYIAEDLIEDSQLKDSKGDVYLDKTKIYHNRRKLADQIFELFEQDMILWFAINRYNMALKDFDNQFFYLYDIKESIKVHFQSMNLNYVSELNLKSKFDSDFGRIANHLPLFQSRHRGEHVKKQMMAETDVIIQLRTLTRELILKFIRYQFKTNKHQADII